MSGTSTTAEHRDVEAWAEAYVLSTDLEYKLAPPPPPRFYRERGEVVRLEKPGRPAEFRPARRRERTPKPEALRDPLYRARVLHAFVHHELQAADLMCWAVLAFPQTE